VGGEHYRQAGGGQGHAGQSGDLATLRYLQCRHAMPPGLRENRARGQ
jgi:hypothetical protein